MFYGMNAWFLSSLALGALLWVAFVAAPAWRRLPLAAASQAFGLSWGRGGPVLAALAAASCGLGFAAAVDEPDFKWAIGAALWAAALLFAALLMRKDAALVKAGGDEAAVRAALRRWSRLHLVRCILGGAGVFFFIWAAH